MEATPKISIIIPAFNAENHIQRCINSLLRQTYYNWEAWIINDGSTDSSEQIIRDYKLIDNRIKLISHPNSGVSYSRNLGLSNITGDYVIFIDSDDWIDEDYIESFITQCDSTTSIIYQGICYDYSYDDKLNHIEYPTQNTFLYYGMICGKLYSSDTIKGILFDKRLSLHEDHIFYYMSLLNAKELKFINKAGYHYMHEGKTSLSRKLQISKDYFLSSSILLSFYPKLKNKYTNLSETHFNGCIQKFGLNQLIMGIFSMYFENKNWADRISILKECQGKKELFKMHYRPNSFIGKVFISIYLYFPILVQDTLFLMMTNLCGPILKKRLNIR